MGIYCRMCATAACISVGDLVPNTSTNIIPKVAPPLETPTRLTLP